MYTTLIDGNPKELQQGSDQSAKEEKQKKAVQQADREVALKQKQKDDRTFKDNQLKNFRADREDRESPQQELARLLREKKKREEELEGKEPQYKNRRLDDSTDRPNFHTSSHKVNLSQKLQTLSSPLPFTNSLPSPFIHVIIVLPIQGAREIEPDGGRRLRVRSDRRTPRFPHTIHYHHHPSSSSECPLILTYFNLTSLTPLPSPLYSQEMQHEEAPSRATTSHLMKIIREGGGNMQARRIRGGR